MIDVEFGPRGALYALSHGVPAVGDNPGDTAQPGTGQLLRVNRDGTFSVIVDGKDPALVASEWIAANPDRVTAWLK